MRKRFWPVLILSVLLTILFYSQAMSNHEDTAQLTFSKTAVSKKDIHTYTIQEGDILSAIIRKLPGITEKDIPSYYRMTKELNPEIDDLNKLYSGQTLVLPGKSIKGMEEKKATGTPHASEAAGSPSYQVKKGDSLIRIVHRELQIKSNTQSTLKIIKSLNPRITDVNKIYIGQIIVLPEGQTAAKAAPAVIATDKEIVTSEQKQTEPETAVEEKASIILSPEARLAVIKHVITQMKGNMLTSGNYYLPVSKTEQLTIDCSTIPVVELADRTTIFLDLEEHANSNLKKMISDRWSNHYLVKINNKDDMIVILKKIFKHTKNYEISKAQKPISAGLLPPLEVIVDWVIAEKSGKQTPSITQGLRFVYENNSLLPRSIINYARLHNLAITEVSPEKGLVGKPEEIYSLPPMTIIPSSTAKDFSYALLSYLSITGEKDVDVRVFNIDEDGFNLSIKADIVVTRGDKKFIIFARDLPLQFVNILKKAGNELIFISDADAPLKTMEKILTGLSFVFTSGYFSFSGSDKNQPPYNIGFIGTKIKTDKNIYVVNFDFNQELRGLMQETWSADILRY